MDKKMKKNKAMRTAGGLFVATMLTTSIVSGTYAKYITEDSAKDNARVAVFGVKVEAGGELFAQTYFDAEQNDANKPAGKSNGQVGDKNDMISVKSLTQYTGEGNGLTKQDNDLNNVVAPGTKNDEGLTLSVSGTPEVDVDIVFTFDTTSDIWLGANAEDEGKQTYYPKMTSGKVYDDTFNSDADVFSVTETYYPVKFTLSGNSGPVVNEGTLADVEEYIAEQLENAADTYDGTYIENTATNQHTYTLTVPAGTNLDNIGLSDLTLKWEWDFDDSTNGTYDKEDTLLGDLAYDAFGNNGTAVIEGALVTDATNAINAAINRLTNQDTDYTDWNTLNGTKKLATLENKNGTFIGTDDEDETANAYNLIANFNMTISVVQVD